MRGQSRPSLPTATVVSPATPCKCIERNRPGYFVKYVTGSPTSLIADIWNCIFTSFGSSNSSSTSYVSRPSTFDTSKFSSCRNCWMPALAACSPILLYSSAARFIASMVVVPFCMCPPRLAVPICVMPMSFDHATLFPYDRFADFVLLVRRALYRVHGGSAVLHVPAEAGGAHLRHADVLRPGDHLLL